MKTKRYSLPRKKAAYWACVKAKPGQERLARLNLQEQGYRAYYPRVKEGRSPVLKPMFPGYLFVRITRNGWYPIKNTYGVAYVIMRGDQPDFIPDRVVDQWVSWEGPDGFIDLSPPAAKLEPGAKVLIDKGPFKNHIASYIGRTAKGRCEILLQLLGKDVTFEIAERELIDPGHPGVR